MPAQDPEDNSKLKRRHVGIFHAKKVAETSEKTRRNNQ